MKWFCGLLLALVLCAVMCSDAWAVGFGNRRSVVVRARGANVVVANRGFRRQQVIVNAPGVGVAVGGFRQQVFVQPQAVFVPHQQFFVSPFSQPFAQPFVLQQGFCR